jgi:hypothetical protein
MHGNCYQASTGEKSPVKKSRYQYKETIVRGTDTGMLVLGSFKRKNIADVLCQRWQLENWEDLTAENIPEFEVRKSIVRDIALFKDSSVVLNPAGKTMFGRWQVDVRDGVKFLTISLSDKSQRIYAIVELLSHLLVLRDPKRDDLFLNYSAPAVQHVNMYNDPFHPVNNQWRIKPSVKESDSAIYARIKNCLLFFAMYFRDHIKRKAETIAFEELPEIFTWYNKGIGLPDRQNLSASWIECFYDKEQALKGYSILRRLIVDYEYEWPSRAPGWTYETQSVLEQMYHRIDKIRE